MIDEHAALAGELRAKIKRLESRVQELLEANSAEVGRRRSAEDQAQTKRRGHDATHEALRSENRRLRHEAAVYHEPTHKLGSELAKIRPVYQVACQIVENGGGYQDDNLGPCKVPVSEYNALCAAVESSKALGPVELPAMISLEEAGALHRHYPDSQSPGVSDSDAKLLDWVEEKLKAIHHRSRMRGEKEV